MLTLTGVGHRYGDRWVFRGVDLQIEEPTSAAILGPSGSGKTTLLAAIGGLISPREGTVALWPRSCAESQGESISWVTQTFSAFSNRTVTDNITCPLLLSGMEHERAQRRATDAMSAVDILDRRNDRARRLSGGELQRAGVARAIAVAADFILADEPTGQLDEATTARVVEAMIVERPPDSLVLVVTHDPCVAARCEQQYRLSTAGLTRVG